MFEVYLVVREVRNEFETGHQVAGVFSDLRKATLEAARREAEEADSSVRYHVEVWGVTK